MKRMILLLTVALLCLSSCSAPAASIEKIAAIRYDYGNLGQLVCTNGLWYGFYFTTTTEFDEDYSETLTLSVSEDPSVLNPVFTEESTYTEGYNAWGDYAAWKKITDSTEEILLFDRHTAKVSAVHTMPVGETITQEQMGFYNGKLYFFVEETVQQRISLMEYDPADGQKQIVCSFTDPKGYYYHIYMDKDAILLQAFDEDGQSPLLMHIDPLQPTAIKELPLPQEQLYSDIAYDAESGNYVALVWEEMKPQEEVALLDGTTGAITPLFSTKKGYFHRLDCRNGKVYAVFTNYLTWFSLDTAIEYDLSDGTRQQVRDIYELFFAGDDVYGVSNHRFFPEMTTLYRIF